MDDSGLSHNELPSGCLTSAPAQRLPRTGYRAGDALQGILLRLLLRSCLTVRDGLGTCPDEPPCLPARQERSVRLGPNKALPYENAPPAGPPL